MTNVLAARMPRVFARMLALAGLSLAAVTADVSSAAAQPGQGMQGMQAMSQMFRDPALQNYRLTRENLDKFVRATNALKALEGEDIDLEDRLHMDDPSDVDLGEIAAAFDSEPRIKTAINGAGMSSRDYVTFLFATMQTMFGFAMVQMGGPQALADMAPGALKDNIQFFTANQSAFEALDDDN